MRWPAELLLNSVGAVSVEEELFNLWIAQDPPFVLFADRAPDGSLLRGNDRFSGFCKDLLDAIAAKLHFNYALFMNQEQKYGQPHETADGTREWNGLISDLIAGVRCSILVAVNEDKLSRIHDVFQIWKRQQLDRTN